MPIANNGTIQYIGHYRTRSDVVLGHRYIGDRIELDAVVPDARHIAVGPSTGVVFVGTHLVHKGVPGFARLNMIFVALAMVVAWLLLREYRRITAPARTATEEGRAA